MPSAPRSSVRLAVIGLLLGSAGLAANACSGKTENGSSSGTSGSSGSSGSTDGGGPNNPACPASDPQDGTACTKDGLLCEYGDDFNPLCNVVRVCSGTRWARPITYSSAPKCPSTAPTLPPNPAECAATRAAVPEGQACTKSGDAAGTTCKYDGASCTCGTFCPSYPVARPDCNPDAGVIDNCCDRSKVQWHCFDGPAYCKTPRPRVGSTCTNEGEKCAVSEPTECGDPFLACDKGIWTLPAVGCPISTGRAKREIAYVDRDETDQLHEQVMSTRLATYRYKSPAPDGMGGNDARHLGFIIEDMPEGSAAVLPSRDRVDLYGYTSMTVASLQHQQREIDALKAELAKLREENAAMKRAPRR
jgi:hypothetical protein